MEEPQDQDTRTARAKVTSKAQSEAHKSLRQKYKLEYQELYQSHKERLQS